MIAKSNGLQDYVKINLDISEEQLK